MLVLKRCFKRLFEKTASSYTQTRNNALPIHNPIKALSERLRLGYVLGLYWV